jgi:hypothetical protein
LQIIISKKKDNSFPLFFFLSFFHLPFSLSVSFFSFFFHPSPPIPRFNLCKTRAQADAEIKPDTTPRPPPCSPSQTRRQRRWRAGEATWALGELRRVGRAWGWLRRPWSCLGEHRASSGGGCLGSDKCGHMSQPGLCRRHRNDSTVTADGHTRGN